MGARHLAGLSLLLAGCAGGGASGPQRPQRVVLITLDTLRADALAPERGHQLLPATDALAREGLRFTNFWATTSTTQPSHATLFTGRYPWHHGVTRNGIVLGEESHTLAEELAAAGYATHAIVASFPLHGRFGYGQGFARFEDAFDEPYVQVWEGEATEGGRFFSLAESVTERALAALDAAQGERQFFWFHYFDPHDPYGDTAAGATTADGVLSVATLLGLATQGSPDTGAALARAHRLYESDNHAMDRSLARLYARLAGDADRFDTHLIVTADHGESFGEHGAIGHGKRVTREQVQVPLVIHSPRVAPGLRDDPASLVDLPRTILSLVGLDGEAFGGRDLTLPGGSDAPVVYGMRRSFAAPKGEVTTEGPVGPLPETWYFQVRGQRLLSGNADAVLEEDDRARPLDGPDAAELMPLFAHFDRLLAEGPETEELQDPEVLEALSALGYTP